MGNVTATWLIRTGIAILQLWVRFKVSLNIEHLIAMGENQISVTAEYYLIGNHLIIVLYRLSKTSLSSWTGYLISVR